jgi:hypothetical protein
MSAYASGNPDRLLLERAIAAQQVISDEYQSNVVVGVASAPHDWYPSGAASV